MDNITYNYFLLDGVVYFADEIPQMRKGYFTSDASETDNTHFMYFMNATRSLCEK